MIDPAINFKCDQVVIEVAREYCSEQGLLLAGLTGVKNRRMPVGEIGLLCPGRSNNW
jgi:hypothetical protein